jgi:hypothetical protein
MAYRELNTIPIPNTEWAGRKWIHVRKHPGGGFRPEMWWINNEETDIGLFGEPWQSHPIIFETEDAAFKAAKDWGQTDGVPVFLKAS